MPSPFWYLYFSNNRILSKSHIILDEFMSRPLVGVILCDKVLWEFGHTFYPPQKSEHFKLLQLYKFPIGDIYVKTTPVTSKKVEKSNYS